MNDSADHPSGFGSGIDCFPFGDRLFAFFFVFLLQNHTHIIIHLFPTPLSQKITTDVRRKTTELQTDRQRPEDSSIFLRVKGNSDETFHPMAEDRQRGRITSNAESNRLADRKIRTREPSKEFLSLPGDRNGEKKSFSFGFSWK